MNRSQALRRLEDWFASRGWRSLPFQRAMWRHYLAGESGLLHTPTGSGKTLAMFGGPLLQAMRLTFVTICLNFVLSNGLTFMGDVLGMAAAFSVYLARQHRLGYDTAQSDSLGTLGRVHYDRLQYRHY